MPSFLHDRPPIKPGYLNTNEKPSSASRTSQKPILTAQSNNPTPRHLSKSRPTQKTPRPKTRSVGINHALTIAGATPETAVTLARLETEVDGLKAQLDLMRQQLDNTKAQRDKW